MRTHVLSYSLILLLGLFVMPTTQAESDNGDHDYRLPTYDKIEFKAEANSDNKVSMSWNAFEGHNDEEFAYYKVIRSHGNPNPLYPEDGAIAFKGDVGDTRHTDSGAWKSAYYRVCVITDVKGRHCSNAVWVEIEKKAEQKWDKNKEWEDKKAAEREAWEQKQDEAKERLAAKKEWLGKRQRTTNENGRSFGRNA